MEYIKDKVSVVIPTYKRSETLERAIKSVAEQTYKNIEILVVDDNEPGSEESVIVADLIKSLEYENLILVTQDRHINGAAARNAGIRKATGEYIAFLDDDDLWMPNKIEIQVQKLSKLDETYGGISTRKIYYLNDKQDHISEVWETNKRQNFDIMSKKLNVSTCTLLLRRACLDKTGYFDENLRRHQEVQLLSFFTSKYKVGFVDDILTIIDCSDIGNRPSATRLLELKNDYFRAIEPVLNGYNSHKRKLVIAHNMTEVAWAFYRDGDKKRGLSMLLKCLVYPSVAVTFVNRVIDKQKAKNSLNKYNGTVLKEIENYVNSII